MLSPIFGVKVANTRAPIKTKVGPRGRQLTRPESRRWENNGATMKEMDDDQHVTAEYEQVRHDLQP